jgi:plasmid stability protein
LGFVAQLYHIGVARPDPAHAGQFFFVTTDSDINAIIDYNDGMQTEGAEMSSITIRNLDPAVKERLRIRAAQHGHSMEAEARSILQSSLKEPERLPARNLYERIRARFEPLGGADDLELPPRLPDRDPPQFD